MSINTRPNHVSLSSFKKTLVKLHCLSSKHNALNVLSFSWWCLRLKKSKMFLIEDNFVDLKCQDKRKHCLKLDIICNVLCVFSFFFGVGYYNYTDRWAAKCCASHPKSCKPICKYYSNLFTICWQKPPPTLIHTLSKEWLSILHAYVHMAAGLFTCCFKRLTATTLMVMTLQCIIYQWPCKQWQNTTETIEKIVSDKPNITNH